MRILILQAALAFGTAHGMQLQTRRIGDKLGAMQPDAPSVTSENTSLTTSTPSMPLNGWTKKHSETISREPFNNSIETGEPGRIWSAGLQGTTIAAFREYISKGVKPGSQSDTEPCSWDECALYACGYCETIDGSVYCPETRMTDDGGAIMVGEVQDFCTLRPEAKSSELSNHSCREALNLGPGEVPPAVKHATHSNSNSTFSGENPTVMDSLAAKPGESLRNKIGVTTQGHVMCSGMVFHFTPRRQEAPSKASAISPQSILVVLIISLLIISF